MHNTEGNNAKVSFKFFYHFFSSLLLLVSYTIAHRILLKGKGEKTFSLK